MQVKFKLHARVQPTLRERTIGGSTISGTLFFEVNGVYFPAESWGDYISPFWGGGSKTRLNSTFPTLK